MDGQPRRIGRYRLLRKLGEGGMGTVYLGEEPGGGQVAVKLLHHAIAADPDFRRRFRREVEAAKRVARFCTAAVLDADVDGQIAYLVTEYVPGPTLRQAVERHGPLRGSSLDSLAVSIAVALRAVHAAGIVHRDLKPGNVLLSPVGPKVIDFGIAHLADATAQMSSVIMGTPSFMSPEQLEGGPVTPASDVFAWGGTIAYAATGRPPFGTGPASGVAYRVINKAPDLSGFDGPLRALVERALAKDPAQRPTVQQILDALTGRPALPTALLDAPSAAAARRRRLRLLSGAGAVVLAVAATAAIVTANRSAGAGGEARVSATADAAANGRATGPATATAGASATSAPATGGNPLRDPGVRFFYTVESQAQRQADIWAAQGREDDARLMRALAQVPHSVWLDQATGDVERTVAETMRLAGARDAVPVFVTDNIPGADCSDRGAAGEQAYRSWIERIAAGIGGGRAVVVLEPNGLAELPGTPDCDRAGPAQQAERYRELTFAVDRLGALPRTAVYLDGGIDGWPEDLDVMADRLLKAGVQRADGFYLNSSDYQPTERLLTYGEKLSRCLHLMITSGARDCRESELAAVPSDAPLTHFVIDTSRNGKGTWDPPKGKYADPQPWCNAPGRGVGARPTTDTGNELADAFLWIRWPERSNGRCRRGGTGEKDPVYGLVAPPGGTWWSVLALERAKNADPPLR